MSPSGRHCAWLLLAVLAVVAVRADDIEVDVVVVGGGAAGLSAAIGAKRDDPSVTVVLLEKAAAVGGTSIRSGGRLWVPNNPDMLNDSKADAMKYMARLAHPRLFSPDAPFLGLDQRHYELIEAYYDNGGEVVGWLRDRNFYSWEPERIFFEKWSHDALNLTGRLEPDYWPNIPENTVKEGRTIAPFVFNPKDPHSGHHINAGASLGGPDLIKWLHYGCEQSNVTVHLSTRVVDLDMRTEDDGTMAVQGVHAIDASGQAVYYRVRRGVVFASGGFSQARDKLAAYVTGPITGGGCGVSTNTGDFLDIAQRHGFMLDNVHRSWFIENIFEQWLKDPKSEHNVYMMVPNYLLYQAYWLQGDSMFQVDSRGRRLMNEKGPYNERTEAHFYFDNSVGDYTARFMFNIFDEHTLKHFWGPPGQILPDIGGLAKIKIGPAKDRPTLVAMIRDRLHSLREHTGNFQLQADFETNLEATWERFNAYARSGRDLEFHRGESFTDVKWHAFCLNLHGVDALGMRDCISANVDEKGVRYPNPTMRPLADTGPYYAVIMSSGMQDTNGGPAIDRRGQVLDQQGHPISGLFGAGNCIGSPAGYAYWGAGSTLGPAVVFGHVAGRAASQP